MNPIRIQRKRTKGWKMPPNTIYVGRPTQWGNYSNSFLEFEQYAEYTVMLDPDWLAPLRGKNLACWCRLDEPCHADILLRLANDIQERR